MNNLSENPACGREEAVKRYETPTKGTLCIATDIGTLPACGSCWLNYLPAQARAVIALNLSSQHPKENLSITLNG